MNPHIIRALARVGVRVDSNNCIRIEPRKCKPPMCDVRLPKDWQPMPGTIYRGVIR